MIRKFKVTVNNEVYEVQVEEIIEGGVNTAPASEVQQPIQNPNPVVVEKPTAAAPSSKPQSPGSGQPVVAPLPGVVLNILVKPGDKVTAGQTVVILEAMKMENEITAPVSGTVSSLLVSKGQSVNTNDTLLTIE